ncbi:MAG: hypothetical protein J5606_06625 [Bacteroidales bacterium]|nr:hypothetical protein [Bacteroidales bacterium]
MKKVVLLAVAAMFVFVGCKKDGIYNPKKKISKITYIYPTYSGIGDNDTTTEVWKWDKNKLKQIVHYSWVENFVYDKNGRLLRIENIDYDEYIWFEYEGNKLKKASMYDGGTMETTEFDFEYNGKKLSKITVSYPRYDTDVKKEQNQLLSAIFEPAIAQIMEDNMARIAESQSTHKGKVAGYTVSFEWSGKNISKMIYDEDGETTTYELTYDDKINPFNGFLELYIEASFGDESDYIYKNKNNIKTITGMERNKPYIINFDYEYDGNWPVQITKIYPGSSEKYISQIEYRK